MKLIVKVIPGSSKTQISGWLDEALKIRVKEPPEKGKANQSVRATLSQALGLPIDNIQITADLSSIHKTIQIKGLNEAEVCEKLSQFPTKQIVASKTPRAC